MFEERRPLSARIWDWIRNHKVWAAGAVAAVVVARILRWVAGFAWAFGGHEGIGLLVDHWALTLAIGAGLFVVLFAITRAGFGWVERLEERRKQRAAERQAREEFEAQQRLDADKARAEDRAALGLGPESLGSVWTEMPPGALGEPVTRELQRPRIG